MYRYNLLKTILEYKQQWIHLKEKKYPIDIIQRTITPSCRSFYEAIFKPYIVFILECKKASPSKGLIRKNFNIKNIINVYKHYASVISVITDSKYFYGSFNFMKQASEIAQQPILCKDFIISPWQIYFARLHKADAILLILSILDNENYKILAKTAHNMNMGVLTEVSNEKEWNRAITLKAKVIGINNRNLHDFSINISRTITISKKQNNGPIIISESGIKNYQQIRKLSAYVHGFLIGSSLMSKQNLNTAIRQLLLGENKVCGLTRTIDAEVVYQAGSLYGGLIFVPESLRYINIYTARQIVSKIPSLLYVGIFQNDSISNIINITNTLNLSVIQLHGQEDQKYINQLHNKLPKNCSIWKSCDMRLKQQKFNLKKVKRYILDNGGGSGKTFDWKLLNNIKLNNIILAGGLSINNCTIAINLGCAGLDFNSGVEKKPGIKDHKKIKKIFTILRYPNLQLNTIQDKKNATT